MWRSLTLSWTPPRPRADLLALQGIAERAGRALACPFSSSEEFEAAVIRSRRAAGVYRRRWNWRYLGYAGAATGMLVVGLWMI
jgi:hypothetical protein